MPLPPGWLRVSKKLPCPVCGHERRMQSWCLVKDDGSAAVCARVISDTPFGRNGAGWVHRLQADVIQSGDGRRRKRIMLKREPEVQIDAQALAKKYHEEAATDEMTAPLDSLCEKLGLGLWTMVRLRIGWNKEQSAWSFPMRAADNKVIGIRLRGDDGCKWAVKGSRSGVFIPTKLSGEGPLVIAEGPTDVGALLELGYDAIGRPDCMSGTSIIVEYCRRQPRRDIVIVHDRDEPGTVASRNTKLGAKSLVERLGEIARSVRVLAPPGYKDVREWVNHGATRQTVDCVIGQALYQRAG